MFYDFPVIETIDDVLPHIEGREEFNVMYKDDYTVINYMVAFEETFMWDNTDSLGSAIRRECRGITFDKSGKLICRKYHKFFNANEKEETQLNKINLYEPHVVLEKLDGSLICAQPTNDGFVLVTKSGVTEISQQAEAHISNKYLPPNSLHKQYHTFIQKCLQRNVTPIFEWCSRKNRIVIDYSEDQLILTGMRHNNTGHYVSYEVMKNYASAWNIPVVQAVNGLAVQDIHLFVKQVREWEDEEGVVVRFDTGHMIKIKADQYVLRHKTKEQISQEKNVLQVILNDEVDDVVPLLMENDAKRLLEFQKAFWLCVEELSIEMAELFVRGNTMYPEQKDFAVKFVQRMILPIHAPIMYGMKRGKGSKEIILEMISKSLTSQTKIDQNRWLFGWCNWNA